MAREDIFCMSSRELKKLHIVHQAIDRQITQKTAASMLDLCERQVRRLVKSVRECGGSSLVHRGRGQPSNRRLSEGLKTRVLNLCRQKYLDFGSTLASEKLLERDGIAVNRETLRQWRLGSGFCEKKRKKGQHRQWRVRKGCFGEMVQMDGSHHAWLEERGPELVLMGYIDDATNTAYAQFYDYEGTLPAMDSFKRYVRRYGLPVSVYLDKHSTYKSPRKLTVEEELAGVSEPLSQFERALKELGVKVIHAHSPQAKGRIERLFGTLQDRLVKEMRLSSIATREEANAFLREYLPAFNRRFQVTPANKANVHVKPEPYFNLDRYLCLKTNRTVRNDNTVAHEGKLYQIMEKAMSRKVIVEERIDGSLHLSCRGMSLKYRQITERPRKANPPSPPRNTNKSHSPARDHPWRRSPLKSVVRKQIYEPLTK